MAENKKIVIKFGFVYALFVLAFLVVMFKVFYIQTVERNSWAKAFEKIERDRREVVPNRGNIYTHDGKLISATVPYYALYMDTQTESLRKGGGKLLFDNIDSLSHSLAAYFGDRTQAEYKEMIRNAFLSGNRRLRLVPKRVTYVDYKEVVKFPLFEKGRTRSGLFAEEYVRRENLYGDLSSRTIGNMNRAGDAGAYGLEMEYDSILAGVKGVACGKKVGGGWVYENEKEPVEGKDLITTLDIELQDICDRTLRDKLESTAAKKGCLLLMDVKTGAIRASVNLRRREDGTYAEIENMSVSDLSEPGSTFKMISLMVALEDGKCELEDMVDTKEGDYKFYGVSMTDHNKKHGGNGVISIEKAIAVSSNIGISRVVYDAYRKNQGDFVDAIYDAKLVDDMNIEIPGAAVPKVPHPDTYAQWSGLSLPWMSIGYVAQMPPIYTLAFYNAIANGGKLMRPYYVEAISSQGSVVEGFEPTVINSSICSSSTLKDMQKVLKEVMKTGTGSVVASDYIDIAGKTGTAQLGYGIGGIVRHQVSFCGYFPADNPQYSAIVVIREPSIGYASGSYMAGGVFKQVAERVNAHVNKRSVDDVVERDSIDVKNEINIIGQSESVKSTLEVIGKEVDMGDDEWLSVKSNEDGQVHAKTINIADGYVPDVRGMGATDAIFLIEKTGMRVQMYGRGRVESQSVVPNTKATRGRTVVLVLR